MPGDKLVYGHIANMPRRQVRSELLAELAAMRDFNDDSVLAGREVNRLGVGDVVVLGDGTTWSLASIGVVAVEVSKSDQINDGRSWTEVLDEEFANGIEPLSKPISEVSRSSSIWLLGSDPMALERRRLSICSRDSGIGSASRDRTPVSVGLQWAVLVATNTDRPDRRSRVATSGTEGWGGVVGTSHQGVSTVTTTSELGVRARLVESEKELGAGGPNGLLDVAGLADRLGVGERLIRRLVDQRRIPFHKIGKYVRFDPEEVSQWVDRCKVDAVR